MALFSSSVVTATIYDFLLRENSWETRLKKFCLLRDPGESRDPGETRGILENIVHAGIPGNSGSRESAVVNPGEEKVSPETEH